MQISECMCRNVQLCSPDDTLREAARKMKACDAGAMPVGDRYRLLGMITDRDIVVRALAEGKGPDTKVREAMTQQVYYAFDDEDLVSAAETMSQLKIRRLPILNHQRQLVGILSFSDIWNSPEAPRAAAALAALQDAARHGGPQAQAH